jgi:hypothetical protein
MSGAVVLSILAAIGFYHLVEARCLAPRARTQIA